MTAHAPTIAFAGIDCLDIDVQVQIAAGFVGLPEAVGESRERVRAAFNALRLALPPKRITVNLAPASSHNLLMLWPIAPEVWGSA